jgi:NADPH-dependent curcumin reductase
MSETNWQVRLRACPDGIPQAHHFEVTEEPLGPLADEFRVRNEQGFVVFDHAARFEEAVARLAGWLREGKLRHREDILDGIEQAPGAIAGLYRGENLGKRLIRVEPG